jgi:hypothetical protein
MSEFNIEQIGVTQKEINEAILLLAGVIQTLGGSTSILRCSRKDGTVVAAVAVAVGPVIPKLDAAYQEMIERMQAENQTTRGMVQ